MTGSQHLIETESRRLLLDCGLFQGRDEETGPKNAHFGCGPRKLDAVILSHSHIDHCGNLPGLVKAGYEGDIYCTRATADIAGMMLRDSAKIQKEDAAYRSEKENPNLPRDVSKLRASLGKFRGVTPSPPKRKATVAMFTSPRAR